jgi:hypothetical protein
MTYYKRSLRWPFTQYRRDMGWKARWFVPLTEKHYGVRHIWLGPIHAWYGVSLNDKKLHRGIAWR